SQELSLPSQIGCLQTGILQNLVGWSVMRDRAKFENIGVIRDGKRRARVLLHDEHRSALGFELRYNPEDVPDDERCKAEARFIQHQKWGIGNKRSSHREHLTLATGQC